MIRIFSTILIGLFYTIAFPQVVTIPEYPTENDSIKIIFDATQGGQGMMGYTGTLYTHTGVVTNLSGGSWAHVIGSWGNNTTQPSLTRLGPNLYELVIGYPREFYNITNPAEHIEKLAFVFRSANGSQQTEDIFVNIYEPGLNLIVENPQVSVEFGDPLRSPAFVNQDDTINISITAVQISTVVQSITLFVNNIQAAQTSGSQLNFNFIGSNYSIGAQNISAIGIDTAGIADTVSFIIFKNPVVQNAPLPAGVIPGINYISGTTVTFALFAPYKDFIYLIGDFNDWKVNTNYHMKKYEVSADSVVWWLTLDSFTPGQEVIFQYLVDGNLRIADPYSEKISDPWDDHYISNNTYPDLIDYPDGKTFFPASVIETARPPYQWQIQNFQPPAKTDLVIYELLVRDFLAAHDYKTLKDTLNYLKELGVNAIELMPVTEFEGNESWGYNSSFHFAADKYYGPREDLKAFIDKAHEMGFAIIIDIVLNHAYGQSPLARLYWNITLNRPAANNPWFNQVSPNPVYAWGNDFNHTSIHTKNYIDRVNKYWLTEYNVDGFRFDFTKGFTNTPGDGGNYDAARIAILKRMADEIWEVNNEAYIILEHFTANSEEKELSDYGAMLWGNLNSQYSEAAMGYHDNNKSNFAWGAYTTRGWDDPHLVTYMESHDEERMMFRNLTYGNSSAGYDIRDLRVALNRIKLAAAFFFTIPGPKMIWQFGELGYDVSIDDPCRVCNKPIRWFYFNDDRRRNVYKVFAALTDIKKNYDVFRTSDIILNVSGSGKRINLYHTSMDVSIVGNFGVNTSTVDPNFNRTGIWYDFFSGDSIEVLNPTAHIILEPGEFHIYSTVRLPAPEPGILLEVEDITGEHLVTEYNLEQNYPNPFNPSTEIIFHVRETSPVTIKIYDLLGREVKTLVNEEKSSGIYRTVWNGDNNFNEKVSTGIYFYRMEAGEFNSIRKMILLK